MGGFGGGNIFLAGDGSLQGFNVTGIYGDQVTNETPFDGNFFSISSSSPSTKTQAFALLSPTPSSPDRMREKYSVLPPIKSITMEGKYPTANITYDIDDFPCQVTLEATTPMIPTDVKNSSLPLSSFTFHVDNPSNEPVDIRLMQSQVNFIGWKGVNWGDDASNAMLDQNVNTPTANGIVM